MYSSTRTNPDRSRLWQRCALPAALIVVSAAGLTACGSRVGVGEARVSPSIVTHQVWSGPAADGGYRCLRDTGGASGQCNAAMGIRERDSGYACLRDTGGASGQCNAAIGLRPTASTTS
jgi:hypothetical protein